jgi:mannose-6-phosphate isomerase-like protein (cupin superfamily)
MKLTAGDQVFTCKQGDSVSFRADTPHIISNPGKKPLRVFWVVSPPKNMVNKAGR